MIHITSHKSRKNHNSKLDGIRSINTSPLKNQFCQSMGKNRDYICSACYAKNSEKCYPNLHKVLMKNSRVLSGSIIPVDELPVIDDKIFRFNSFGELINKIHLENLLNIVRKNDKTIFTLWTKRIDIVNDSIKKPSNMILIYSTPRINPPIITLPYKVFDKVFSVFNRDRIEKVNCHSQCKDCLLCYSFNDVRFIDEYLK